MAEGGLLVTLRVLNRLKVSHVIQDYAIFGAVAVSRWTEPINTQDLNILVVVKPKAGIILLTPVFEEFGELGYGWRGAHIMVWGIPVQFMVADDLETEAVQHARILKVDGVMTKVVSPEYLIALLARVGRAKDKAKIELLLEQANIDDKILNRVLGKYGLLPKFTGIMKWLKN